MGRKRYILEYDVRHPEIVPGIGGLFDHNTGYYSKYHCAGGTGNSMKTMKGYIRRIRREYAACEPHGFRVYDFEAPDEPDGHIGQVYYEE